MHHGHSLSTGENVLPPLSDFTVTTRVIRSEKLPPMSFSQYQRERLRYSDWDVDMDTLTIRVRQPKPDDVEVCEEGYAIVWEGE